MELYIVRHGQSVNNAGAHEQDPRLTEKGHDQARRAGRYLPDGRLGPDAASRSLDLIVCSPLRRAIQTAQGINESHNCQIMIHPSLHEVMGPEPGLSVAEELLTAHPDVKLHSSMPGDNWWPDRGEEDFTRFFRAQRAARWLRADYEQTDKLIAVITHGTFGTYFLNALLGLTPSWRFRTHHLNCGISKIVYEDGIPALYYQNELEHLPYDMRT